MFSFSLNSIYNLAVVIWYSRDSQLLQHNLVILSLSRKMKYKSFCNCRLLQPSLSWIYTKCKINSNQDCNKGLEDWGVAAWSLPRIMEGVTMQTVGWGPHSTLYYGGKYIAATQSAFKLEDFIIVDCSLMTWLY